MLYGGCGHRRANGRGRPAAGSSLSDAIIQLEHVSKRFGQMLAVDDVTVDVPRGRCFAWLGPNGCGKTTLIRMMLGLAKPTGGRIQLRGLDVPRDIRQALSRVGGIVEEPRFYPYLSGRRNLEVWAAHYGGEARSRIPSVLERVALSDRASDKVKTYSLGMRQRLGVARALLNDPELLVLDEPTNGLDPAGMLEFRNMIRDLVEKEGRTVFISSHILDEVQKMADDIAIVQAGKLISWGRVDALIAAGRHSVLVRTDDEEGARSVLSGIAFVTGVKQNDEYKALDLEVAEISDERLIAINRALVEAGVGVAEIWRESESLEDRFLDLTADSKPGDMTPVRGDGDAGG
jgi:ABC-2 type transport system ATP-binding protein